MAFDMCVCDRNWQGNDCSQRVCPFGRAHVDTPKGDLDMSNDVTGPDVRLVQNHEVYPYGTTEQYPRMEDSNFNIMQNSAHDYMECSNKGTCNRETGACECFDGYDGVACQRASCPGFPAQCSSHGVCKSAAQLANADYGNVYKLWDRYISMGCECDPGYYGPDCSLRDCKFGVDPLYADDILSAKIGVYNFAVLTTGNSGFTGGTPDSGKSGTWAIRFFDYFGDDWLTEGIPAEASCAEVIAALENLPPRVIPKDTLSCMATSFTDTNALDWNNSYVNTVGGNKQHVYTVFYRMANWVKTAGSAALSPVPDSYVWVNGTQNLADFTANSALAPRFSGTVYRIKFNGNPGGLQEPQIDLYLDGKSPTLLSSVEGESIVTFVVSDGEIGESTDHVADHCNDVVVSVDRATKYFHNDQSNVDYVTLGGLDDAEVALLKACLGDSDGNPDNNVERFNWDHGSPEYPHLIKLVRTQSTFEDSPYYAALYWNETEGVFRLINPFSPPDQLELDWYDVYTTKGTLAQTSNASALFGYGSRHLVTTVKDFQTVNDHNPGFDGNIACESNPNPADVAHCLSQGDLFTVLDPVNTVANSPYINLYKARRVWTGPPQYSVNSSYTGLSGSTASLSRGVHMIETDNTLNWGGDDRLYSFNVYKFTPNPASSYTYFGSCSNRGTCIAETGLCECFDGYTGDNCHIQETIGL